MTVQNERSSSSLEAKFSLLSQLAAVAVPLWAAIDEISFRAINWRGKFLPSQVISLAR